MVVDGMSYVRTARLAALMVIVLGISTRPATAQGVVKVFAAGSLSGVMAEIGSAVAKDYGITIAVTAGPSGTLRERIEKGERVDLFASANMEHPLALSGSGASGPTVLFARNAVAN
jgi:molybdate transport system substrate-binding protein